MDTKASKRFWAKVDRKAGGCWEWRGACNPHGYGQTTYQGKQIGAHRLAVILLRGSIPPGKHVLHSCDHPPCVRPDHLRVGTAEENARDRMIRGRHVVGKRYDHPYPIGPRLIREKLIGPKLRYGDFIIG